MIRPAVVSDIPSILVLGKLFFDQAGWPQLASWDEPSVAQTLGNMIANPQAILLVAEFNGEIVGMAGAFCEPYYFNYNLKSCFELFWYVTPAHRVGAGGLMLTAMEDAARVRGAHTFTLGAVVGMRDEALAKAYARRGYRNAERTFIRTLT